MVLIKELRDGKKVIFDKGNFDNFCIYVVDRDGSRFAPHDETYFTQLQAIDFTLGIEKVYDDFLLFYSSTWEMVDREILSLIEKISDTYPSTHIGIVEQWLTVIYAGMVAEERKENSKLKKRIKRLGMYQTLVEKQTPHYAAKYSTGKEWRILDEEMKKIGF